MYVSHVSSSYLCAEMFPLKTTHKKLPKQGDLAASPTVNVQLDRVGEMWGCRAEVRSTLLTTSVSTGHSRGKN